MLFKVLAGVLVCPAACASALRSRVSALEEELQAKAATLRSVQSEVAQSKKELSAKELSIQRGRDELSMAHTRMAQESERVNTHTAPLLETIHAALYPLPAQRFCFVTQYGCWSVV